MADENKKTIIISAVDDSLAAIESAKRNFASLPKEIQKQYKMTNDGIAVSMRAAAQSAKNMGRTVDEQMDVQIKAIRKYRDARAQAADDERYAAQQAKEGGKQIGAIGKFADSAAGGLAKMAAKALSVGAALETVRQGYMTFATYDTHLRRLQNSIGGSRTQVEAFGSMFKDVALRTGDDLTQLQVGFKSFLDKSMVKPSDAKKMFPDIALYAKGAGASVDAMASVAGDAMRNLSIPASDYKKVLESTVRVADDLNVDVGVLASQGTRLSEVMAGLGYSGADAFAKMGTYVGIANRATGNTAQSIQILSHLMERMIGGDKGIADAIGMPVEVMLANLEKAKKEGDPMAWMVGMFAKSNKQREILQAVGVKDAKVVRELTRAYGDMNEEIEKTANAKDGMNKSKRMIEGPQAAVERLTASLSILTMEIGHFLDAFGVTTTLTFFAKLLGDIARGAERVLSLVEALQRWELPSWVPKSWTEFSHRAATNILGAPGVPWEQTREGMAEAKKKGDTGLTTTPVRPAESVPLSRSQPGAWEQNYSVGQRPGGGVGPEKINYTGGYRVGGGTSGATEFSSRGRQRDPNIQNASFTGTDPAKKIAKAIADEQQGGGYGSSTDAKYLRASYHPGGGGGAGGGGFGSSGVNSGVYDQAGPPGSGGTGYGGGTDLAPSYTGGQRRSRTGGHSHGSEEAPTEQAPQSQDNPIGPELQPGTYAPVLPPELGGPKPGETPAKKESWVKEDQSRVAGIRKGALSDETRGFLQQAGERHRLRADVYSGGQRMKGAPGHTGSHRHDQGGAADLKLWDPEQKRYLNSKNPADAKRMEAYTASAVEFGATGVGHGHGYMGPESLHIGGGKTASWGGSEIANKALRAGIVARARRKQDGHDDHDHTAHTASGTIPGLPKELQTAAAAPAAGGTASGDYQGRRVNADVLKTRIQQSNAEWMKDPKNQQKIFRTLQAEGGGNITANLEQMSNYAASRNKTLEQVVNARGSRQFYGPLRRFHGDPGSGPMMKHERDAYFSKWTDAKQKAWDKASNDVFSGGSNKINYATDQGTVGDPNYNPNTMTNVGGNMFGVQPGTGKWVSAQRGKPQVSGPVAVAGAETPMQKAYRGSTLNADGTRTAVIPDVDSNRRMEKHREFTGALAKGEGAIQQQDREHSPGQTTQFPLKSAHGKGEGVTPDVINKGTEGTAEENQKRLEGRRPSDELIMASQRDVNVNLKVNDSSMQFARASMARQVDVEMRKARQNSHGDIGVA